MNLNELTITQAAHKLRAKECSSVELTEACFGAIREKDRDIHAYLDTFEDDAMAQARLADEIFAAGGDHLPHLLGIPLCIKDNILIEGKTCTAGSHMLENYRASYDATVIRALKKHGAVLLGKTNMDEFAMGSSTENSAFGVTKNPRDMARVPGGSSGGSAAAVAADMALGALGSDTGGSIRQPASFCGIVGMKPTYGSVSRHGLIAMASSLDQIGPMAKTAEDAEMIWNAIAGIDSFDSTTVKKPEIPKNGALKELKGLRIGLPAEYTGSGLRTDVKKIVMEDLFKKLEQSGAEVQEIHLPHSAYALAAYYVIVPSEVSSNLARLDGIRYGLHERDAHTLGDTYARARGKGFGTEVKRRIMLGTYALSAGYYDAYYLKAQKVRRLIRQDFERAFEKVDLIMGPTTPTPAFALGEKTQDPLSMYLGDIYTVAVNLAGLPALSLPAGSVSETNTRLPVGLQLIGAANSEHQLFAIAKEIERMT